MEYINILIYWIYIHVYYICIRRKRGTKGETAGQSSDRSGSARQSVICGARRTVNKTEPSKGVRNSTVKTVLLCFFVFPTRQYLLLARAPLVASFVVSLFLGVRIIKKKTKKKTGEPTLESVAA